MKQLLEICSCEATCIGRRVELTNPDRQIEKCKRRAKRYESLRSHAKKRLCDPARPRQTGALRCTVEQRYEANQDKRPSPSDLALLFPSQGALSNGFWPRKTSTISSLCRGNQGTGLPLLIGNIAGSDRPSQKKTGTHPGGRMPVAEIVS